MSGHSARAQAGQLAHGQSHSTGGTLCHCQRNKEKTWEVLRDAQRLQNKAITSPQNGVSTCKQFFSP